MIKKRKKDFKLLIILVLVLVMFSISMVIAIKENLLGQANKVSLLKSDFFKNDPIAQKIALGDFNYDMNEYGLICGQDSTAKSSSYGFKILNAIKQLGYLNLKACQTAGDKVAIIILNEFQRKNGLQESNYVYRKTLLKLDNQIKDIEKRDDAIGNKFTCYNYLKDAPKNDASKNHLSFLYMTAINAFPNYLKVKESECLNGQTWRFYEGQICDQVYWSEYDDNCKLKGIFYVTNLQSFDDYLVIGAVVHEHAHFVDNNVYPKIEGGIKLISGVNTTLFYNISYDVSDSVEDGGKAHYKPRVDMFDINQKKQHFFSYAEGWKSDTYPGYYTASEDFAVSMEMYILHGIEFRDYLKDKPIFAAKYDWIKKNVFKGKEFDTGDPNYKMYAPDLYEPGGGIFSASDITELRPDYVYDYKIKKIKN